ncbi:10288_t:CDS:2, partial [Acaulospora colombiana]
RCLKDLRERFAKVDIQASEPIVPFRETAIKANDMAPPKTPNAPRGTIHGSSAHSIATYTVRAIPLPQSITTFLQSNQSIIARLERISQHEGHEHERVGPPNGNGGPGEATTEDAFAAETEEEIAISQGELLQKPTVRVESFWPSFVDVMKKAGGEWAKYASQVWAFGPNRTGPNLLLDARPEGSKWHDRSTCKRHEPPPHISRVDLEFESSLEAGFQIATLQGPLCAEPVQGMVYVVESLKVDETEGQDTEGMDLLISATTASLIFYAAHSKKAQAKGS